MRSVVMFLALFYAAELWAHAEEGKVSARVGPDKGVLEADEKEGFVLRSSVEKNFAIQKTVLKKGPVWTVPLSALIYSGLETQVMRQRAGHWKSVDVTVSRRSGGTVDIRSEDLANGDLLATEGLGFLKIIEQSVTDPSADPHGH